MKATDSPRAASQNPGDEELDALLAAVHAQLGIAVADRLTASGGPPELRTPDLALDRLLGATHRSMGTAVNCRLSRDRATAPAQRRRVSRARLAQRGPLFHRSAAVRVKYRERALQRAHSYWPLDLAKALRGAVLIAQDLRDSTIPSAQAARAADRLRNELQKLFRLPGPHRPPVALTGLDYLDAVESVLAEPAGRLADELHRILELLDEEIAPALAILQTADGPSLLDLDPIAQDLLDDLARGCATADDLARAVAQVELLSSDFVGADLGDAKLEGVRLEGIMWDAATIWPPHWDTRIRHASLTSDEEEGVLVVAAEQADSMVDVKP